MFYGRHTLNEQFPDQGLIRVGVTGQYSSNLLTQAM